MLPELRGDRASEHRAEVGARGGRHVLMRPTDFHLLDDRTRFAESLDGLQYPRRHLRGDPVAEVERVGDPPAFDPS